MSVLLGEAVGSYLTALEKRSSSGSHLSTVRYRLGRLAREREDVPLRSLTEEQIHEHFMALRESGLSSGTLAGHKRTFLAFWRWCSTRRWCSAKPAAVLRSRAHSYSFRPVRSRAAGVDDFALVVGHLAAFAAHREWKPRDVRDALLVSLAVDSGCRRGELWNLRRSAVEAALDRPQLVAGGRHIYHAESEGKTGAVVIRFFEESADLLRRWLKVMPRESGFVFVSLRTRKRLRADALHLGLLRICEFAGARPFRFHAIRKRVVTDIIAATGDAKIGQLLAGHASVRTTQEYYNDVAEVAVDSAAASLANRLRGGGDSPDLPELFFSGITT